MEKHSLALRYSLVHCCSIIYANLCWTNFKESFITMTKLHTFLCVAKILSRRPNGNTTDDYVCDNIYDIRTH